MLDRFTNCLEKDGPLSTAYRRRKIYEKEFGYISPVQLNIGKDEKGRSCHCHYVPLIETMKSLLLTHKSILRKSDKLHEFSSFADGSIFRENPFFSTQGALPLILFQDDFQVIYVLKIFWNSSIYI